MGGVKMSALIEEFKREHYEIIKALTEVEELGILTKDGKDKLMFAKDSLHEHFKEEDEKFYPVLLREAEQNKKLKEGLDVFEKDLESLSRVVLGFFDGFDKGVLDARLLNDFKTLLMVLRNRMWNEENYLYVEYEELNKL
jgi:hypothetical protein